MKKGLFLILAAAALVSCKGRTEKKGITGVFETTPLTVTAEMPGRLLFFNADEGEHLYKDSVIGLIDTLELSAARALLLESSDDGDIQIDFLKAQLKESERKLLRNKSEQNRIANLISLRAASQKDLDALIEAEEQLKIDVAEKKATLEHNADFTPLQREALDEQVAQVDKELQKCRIFSPVDGTMIQKFVNTDDLITIGMSIFSVTSDLSLLFRGVMNSSAAKSVRTGQEIDIHTDLEDGIYTGTVVLVSERPAAEGEKPDYDISVLIHNDGRLKEGDRGTIKF